MKQLPQTNQQQLTALTFNKEQLELLIASLLFTSNELASSDNLAKTIVELDYSFEHFAYPNPLNKRQLVNDPLEYSGSLFNPLITSLEHFHENL